MTKYERWAASLLAELHTYRGDCLRAEKYCDISFQVGQGTKEQGMFYHAALVSTIRLHYAKGSDLTANLLSAKLSHEMCWSIMEAFLSHFPEKQLEHAKSSSTLKHHISDAILRGSFETVLSATRVIPAEMKYLILGVDGTHYLYLALVSDTPATFFLLRQFRKEIFRSSTITKQPYHCSEANLFAILLVKSIMEENHRAIKLLHQAGVDLNKPLDNDDQHVAVIRELGLKFEGTYWAPMALAISRGDREGVKLLLHLGANANWPGDSRSECEAPIFAALRNAKKPGARPWSLLPLLIEAGANVNIEFRSFRPLASLINDMRPSGSYKNGYAAHCTAVRRLIAAGADVNVTIPGSRNYTGKPERIVDVARSKGLKHIVKLLEEAGA